MRQNTLRLRARYLFPVESPPIEDAVLAIANGKIVAFGPARDLPADIDLGNVAITPGFVNAHTHLELSSIPKDVHDPNTDAPEDEVAWLKRVVAQRVQGSEQMLKENVQKNLNACLNAGTTMLADITTAGLSWPFVSQAKVRSIVFAELIGLKRYRGLQTSDSAWNWLSGVNRAQRPEANPARSRAGLSPHAPYSTSSWLYHHAASSQLPLTTHLAEMPEELQLLESRDGPLRQFLEDLGAWDDDWEPLSPRPADYVRLGELRNADWLIAHGTYLDPEAFWQLRPEAAPNGHRVAVAFCPRTHARFGQAQHPYRELLEKGAIVCIGTDSLASTPSLSVLDEIRFLHGRDPSLSGELLLTMATLFGAWAMRADGVTGSLRAGKSADLAVIALPDESNADPHQLILESDRPVLATMFEGEFLSGPWIAS